MTELTESTERYASSALKGPTRATVREPGQLGQLGVDPVELEARLAGPLELADARRRLPPPPLRRVIRLRAGLTQQDLAGAVGTTRATIARWESGTRTPRGELLLAYVAVLELLNPQGREAA